MGNELGMNTSMKALAAIAMALALVAFVLTLVTPKAAQAVDAPEGGIVLSLDGEPSHADGMATWEVSSYEVSDGGKVVAPEKPLTVTMTDSSGEAE